MKNGENGQWQDIANWLEYYKNWPKDQKLIQDMKFPESVISKYKLDDIILGYVSVHFTLMFVLITCLRNEIKRVLLLLLLLKF